MNLPKPVWIRSNRAHYINIGHYRCVVVTLSHGTDTSAEWSVYQMSGHISSLIAVGAAETPAAARAAALNALMGHLKQMIKLTAALQQAELA